jgi:hypothetical protein
MQRDPVPEGIGLAVSAGEEYESARRPAHQVNLTDFGGALESAPKGIRIPVGAH